MQMAVCVYAGVSGAERVGPLEEARLLTLLYNTDGTARLHAHTVFYRSSFAVNS